MTIPTISTLPVAPARTDAPATFVSRADAFLAAIVVMQGELNTSIGAMNTDIAQANTDATAAAASASAASSSASSASSSASAASSSASAASSSATAAASSYDAFDDRYLGSKASDPVLDNDGNALLTGALYFNSTSDDMKVYTGSTWKVTGPNPDSPVFVDTVTAPDFDLDAIAETKADTAVDVFVYDTSKDSDGGAWRKRTQNTSWYNETLDTATRGSRKEFPAVAVIVAETSQITIYDGDDPSLPMWMVFEGGQANYLFIDASRDVSSISAKNGQLVFGQKNTAGSLRTFNFVSEFIEIWLNTSYLSGSNPFSLRNTQVAIVSTDTTKEIVNRTVNDVAMTVLPNAPIDAATGLPVPTIAASTAGGVSVIKDDGTVADITNSSSDYSKSFTVSFDSENNLWMNQGNSASYYGWVYVFAMPLSGDTTITLNTQTASGDDPIAMFQRAIGVGGSIDVGISGGYSRIADSNVGNSGGLLPFSVDYADSTKSMAAKITSTYNTGYLIGESKLATLSDTDDTDVTGSGELVTNGDFETGDLTGWTTGGGETISVNGSNQLVLEMTTIPQDIFASQADIPVIVGKTYNVSLEVVSGGGSGKSLIRIGDSGNLTRYINGYLDNGIYNFRIVPVLNNLRIILYNTRDVLNHTIIYDNISVKLAEEDRSKSRGLIVNGTITKTPVATGADLVAYSGFSTSNYLEQPYNSNLDFGTGDFCVMGWVKEAASSDWLIDRMEGRDGSSNLWGFDIWQEAQSLRFDVYENNGATSVTSTTAMGSDDGVWNFFTAVRRSGVLEMYMHGKLAGTTSGTARNISYTSTGNPPPLTIGAKNTGNSAWLDGSAALIRISATAPTAEQIAKIYNDEKHLFQENSQATLYGSSDSVTALAYDDDTELLHVGTSAGRSVFNGLRRVDNTTGAVGVAISASNNFIVEE